MAKYDASFKYKVVQSYLNGEGGLGYLSKKFGIKSHTSVQEWVAQFKAYGYEGLERRKKKKIYSMNFKLDVLNYYHKSGLSMKDVSIKFNLPSIHIISRWEKEFNTFGVDGLKPKKRGRTSMSTKKNLIKKQVEKPLSREKILARENELLRAELAFIKKLKALGMDIPERLKNEKPE